MDSGTRNTVFGWGTRRSSLEIQPSPVFSGYIWGFLAHWSRMLLAPCHSFSHMWWEPEWMSAKNRQGTSMGTHSRTQGRGGFSAEIQWAGPEGWQVESLCGVCAGSAGQGEPEEGMQDQLHNAGPCLQPVHLVNLSLPHYDQVPMCPIHLSPTDNSTRWLIMCLYTAI